MRSDSGQWHCRSRHEDELDEGVGEQARLSANNIPVVGHTGLTPQTATNFKKVGQSAEDAQTVSEEAKAIQEAGAFMLVLEHIPSSLGESITQEVSIPTIGIGAGADCDGQVLVINDALGLGNRWPPFSKQYAHCSQTIFDAANEFATEVKTNVFPNNLSK